MAEYKASKTQLRKLDELGIAHSTSITYSAAGELLKAAGWSNDGRTQVEHFDGESSGHVFSTYSEYR